MKQEQIAIERSARTNHDPDFFLWEIIWGNEGVEGSQSQKTPVSASAMLTRKFLQIRKVFATCSLLAEEFPGNLENVRMLHKISR